MNVKEAEELLRRQPCPRDVIAHCKKVSSYAGEIALKAKADAELVLVAAMLHDIGRCMSHGVDHGIVGAEILRRCGLDEKICTAVERHVGAGISMHEAEKLGLPKKNYLPESLDEKIVCMADSLISGEDMISFGRLLSFYRNQGLHESVKRFEKMYGELQSFL